MEYKILKPINYEILASKINYGKYLLNLTLLDYDLLKYSNSIIANSCAIISKKYFEKDNDKIKELYNKEYYNESLIEDAGIINCIKDIKDNVIIILI